MIKSYIKHYTSNSIVTFISSNFPYFHAFPLPQSILSQLIIIIIIIWMFIYSIKILRLCFNCCMRHYVHYYFCGYYKLLRKNSYVLLTNLKCSYVWQIDMTVEVGRCLSWCYIREILQYWFLTYSSVMLTVKFRITRYFFFVFPTPLTL